MYSSPGTPGTTGRSASSSTYTRVLKTGRPIGAGPVPSSGPQTAKQESTVASVGP